MAVPSAGLWRRLLLVAVVVGGGQAARAGPPRPGASRRQGSLPTPRFVCSAEELRGPPVMVHLTVSPLTKPRSREIEMNWRHNDEFIEFDNDTVILTLGDPSSPRARRLVTAEVSSHRGGKFRTKERFRHQELPHENMQNRCTDYWVGYFRARRLLAKNCLKILPAWMWQNREALAPMSLDQMMIPGTHNSGTYKRSRDIVFKLVTTQDEDIWSQLMFGNRYLDMRVGYRPSERDPFWIYHDFFPVRPVNTLIKHVRWFLEFTKEVVILHFHRFPVGFENNMVHTQFVQYLTMELGQWMAPRMYDVTMGELWASDKRLIISYNDWPTRRQNEYLWPSIPQAWGDKKSVSGLYGYLRDEMLQRSGGPQWAAMAELTPSPWDIIIPNRGLRDLAQKANSEVTKWFRDEWWHAASIVASDFFHGNDMIDVSIEANLRRRRCVAGLASRRRGRGRRGRRRALSRRAAPAGPAPERRPEDGRSQRPAPADWWANEVRVAETQSGSTAEDTRRVPQTEWRAQKESGVAFGSSDLWTQESRHIASLNRHTQDSALATSLGTQDSQLTNSFDLLTQKPRLAPAVGWRTQRSRSTPNNLAIAGTLNPQFRSRSTLQAAWWTSQQPRVTPRAGWWTPQGPLRSGYLDWRAQGASGGNFSPQRWGTQTTAAASALGGGTDSSLPPALPAGGRLV